MPFATYPSLKDISVLVTGGASGIGAVIVEEFVRQGSKVAFFDIDETAAHECIERCADEGPYKPMFWRCDLRVIDDLRTCVADVVAKSGPIKVLVNNAANDTRASMRDLSVATWDDMMAVNLRHVAFASQAVADSMAQIGGGSIINFTSPTFRRKAPGLAAYGAAKAGVEGLTRILAREYGTAKIRVNVVMPGWTMTERQRSLWLTPDAEKLLIETQCLKHLVQPADVARLVLFLAAGRQPVDDGPDLHGRCRFGLTMSDPEKPYLSSTFTDLRCRFSGTARAATTKMRPDAASSRVS